MFKNKTVWIIIAVVAVLFFWMQGVYNNMVTRGEEVSAAWSQVENQYQRRMDLIPNLVNTVKGAAAHEQNTLKAVTDARAKVGSLNISADQLNEETLKQFQEAQDELSGALKSLIAVGESYPNIKATENFLGLQTQLEGTENRIATARMDYTNAVKDYNNSVMKFPSNIIAGWFGFEKKPQFQASEAAQSAPEVEF